MFIVASSTYVNDGIFFSLRACSCVGVFTTKEKAIDEAIKALKDVVKKIEDIDSYKELLEKANFCSIGINKNYEETDDEDMQFIIGLAIKECELDKPIK